MSKNIKCKLLIMQLPAEKKNIYFPTKKHRHLLTKTAIFSKFMKDCVGLERAVDKPCNPFAEIVSRFRFLICIEYWW